jgi:tetratricopeptide (TPR) repeat protein
VRNRKHLWITVSMILTLIAGKATFAQRPAQPSTPQSPSSMQTAPITKSTDSQPAEAAQPVSKQENKAIKAFRDTPVSDADRKTQLGEDFITNYPQSRFRPEVVSWLATAYLTKGQVDKLQTEGDKELALTPNNPLSLALLGSNLSRAVNGTTPDLQKHLDQAEVYCKKSLEALETTKKPADVTDEKFTEAKNQTASVAYSGLGTVAFRNQKYPDAISNLDQAVKLGGGADPVNYYLLGKSNEAATNFDAALAAYTKCAAIPGVMQGPCQSSISDVKAHGAALPK